MAPTAVLSKLTSTTVKMNITTNNTLSAYIANTSVVNTVIFFGKYQDTTVGCELMIRTIVSLRISTEPYCRTMMAILFFRRILSLSTFPSVTISELTATVAAYFAMPTGSAERLAECILESVRHAFFVIGNLQGIGFLDSSGKPIIFSDNCAVDIAFFFFRSTVLVSAIFQRFPSTTLSRDFSLRLPYSIMLTASTPTPVLASGIHTPPSTPKPTMIQTPLRFPLLNLRWITQQTTILIRLTRCSCANLFLTIVHFLTPHPMFPHQASTFCLLFSLTSSSTPKMNRVRKSVASVGVTTYLGSFDFLESQASFHYIFGIIPVMLYATRRTAVSCTTEETEYLVTRINKYCDLY